jgi:hypothetical protein
MITINNQQRRLCKAHPASSLTRWYINTNNYKYKHQIRQVASLTAVHYPITITITITKYVSSTIKTRTGHLPLTSNCPARLKPVYN